MGKQTNRKKGASVNRNRSHSREPSRAKRREDDAIRDPPGDSKISRQFDVDDDDHSKSSKNRLRDPIGDFKNSLELDVDDDDHSSRLPPKPLEFENNNSPTPSESLSYVSDTLGSVASSYDEQADFSDVADVKLEN